MNKLTQCWTHVELKYEVYLSFLLVQGIPLEKIESKN